MEQKDELELPRSNRTSVVIVLLLSVFVVPFLGVQFSTSNIWETLQTWGLTIVGLLAALLLLLYVTRFELTPRIRAVGYVTLLLVCTVVSFFGARGSLRFKSGWVWLDYNLGFVFDITFMLALAVFELVLLLHSWIACVVAFGSHTRGPS